MNTRRPDLRTIRTAIELACRAPSVHNSQPWHWCMAGAAVYLHADPVHQLPVTDPTGRELVISCGAALHHAQIAFASLGWRTRLHRLPNPAVPDHLAVLEFDGATEVSREVVRLADAAAFRHTDRRPFLPDPVPAALLAELLAAGTTEHVTLHYAGSARRRRELIVAITDVNEAQRADPAYRTELAAWAARSSIAGEGVPHTSLRAPDRYGRSVLGRDFTAAGNGDLVSPPLDDGAVLAVLSTPCDDRRSWLETGQALSAVLLTATAGGLATCTLSQVTELPAARDAVRCALLDGRGEPQVAVRLGWPVTATFPAPRTARRPLDAVVDWPARER